jgi:hypothetical protein
MSREPADRNVCATGKKRPATPIAFFNVHNNFFNSFYNSNFVIIEWYEPNHSAFQTDTPQALWTPPTILRRALPVDLYWLRCFPTPAYLLPSGLPSGAGGSIGPVGKA